MMTDVRADATTGMTTSSPRCCGIVGIASQVDSAIATSVVTDQTALHTAPRVNAPPDTER